jgi:hypothetical protein
MARLFCFKNLVYEQFYRTNFEIGTSLYGGFSDLWFCIDGTGSADSINAKPGWRRRTHRQRNCSANFPCGWLCREEGF